MQYHKYIIKIVYLCISIYFIYSIISSWEIYSLLAQLHDINLENIKIDNKNYKLTNGDIYVDERKLYWIFPQQKEKAKKFLRLVAFYVWVKEDPLFTINLDNPENLKNAIDTLSFAQKYTSEIAKKDYNIFPITFLNDLISVSQKRIAFTSNPNQKLAAELISIYKQTAKDYADNAKYLAKAIKNSPRKKINRLYFIFINSAVKPSTIDSDLNLIEKNAQRLKEEISLHESCLNGTETCKRSSKKFILSKLKFNKTEPKLDKDIKSFFEENIDNNTISGPFGTYSPCWGWDDKLITPLHYFYTGTRKIKIGEKEITLQLLKLVDEVYLKKPNKINPEDLPLIEQGIPWVYQSETNLYMCSDLNYLPAVLTIKSFALLKPNLFQKASLIPSLPNRLNESIIKGLEAEKTFQQYPNEDNLQILSSYYAFVYKIFGDYLNQNRNNTASYKWIKNNRDSFLNLYLLSYSKQSDFDLTINKLTNEFIILGKSIKLSNSNKFDDYYINAFRSAYSLTFLTFSPLTWRLSEKPQYLDKVYVKSVGPKEDFISYTEAKEIYPDRDISSWNYRKILKE